MTTNNYPNIGYTTLGRDFNYYNKITVTASGFGSNSVDGYQPDIIITFPTYSVTFQMETGTRVEYSFDGNHIHGDMTSTKASASLLFENRQLSKIWFRGDGYIRIEAWGIR